MQNASEANINPTRDCAEDPHSTTFHVEVESGEFAVREALGEVSQELDRFDLDQDEAGTVQLVLAEVLNNIVEHGYRPPRNIGPISIRAKMQSDGLHLNINDQGEPMPEGKLPLGLAQPVDVDLPDLPEGGFGWFLIRDLAHDISYRRIAQENHLRMRIAVGLETVS